MSFAVKAENLNKKYIINKTKEQYPTLRDRLTGFAKPSRLKNTKPEEFWALKDINFQVERGEAVGIIGANGAGKSTLLKILSKISPPTSGNILFRGRVSSLLEVGTGFHPELSGRDNIYLNGAIMGMKREEITKKFDDIVEFSGIGRFLDTPVKHYSSGMSVRLAFSIAASLESEILLLDEVLSVGDAEFQKRSMGKMHEVSEEFGRTVLLVSHNMASIKNICNRCIYLRSGMLVEVGEPDRVIKKYLSSNEKTEIKSDLDLDKIIRSLPEDRVFKLKNIKLSQAGQPVLSNITNGSPLEIAISYQVYEKITGLRVYFNLTDAEDNLIFRSFHDENGHGIPSMEPGDYVSTAVIPANLLGPIEYKLYINAGIYNVRNILPNGLICIPLKVISTSNYNQAYISDSFYGKLAPSLGWVTEHR
jgi:lipopolysaccharide transport system ATP-binding protein